MWQPCELLYTCYLLLVTGAKSAIYDCLVVVVVQFIVPQAPWLTLKDVVAELERRYSTRVDPPVNYIFSNNYFFTDFPAAPPLATADTGTPQHRERNHWGRGGWGVRIPPPHICTYPQLLRSFLVSE